MKEIKPRRGDRFSDKREKLVWELIEPLPQGNTDRECWNARVIEIADYPQIYQFTSVGDVVNVWDGLWLKPETYEYLGNFAKSENFKDFYDRVR